MELLASLFRELYARAYPEHTRFAGGSFTFDRPSTPPSRMACFWAIMHDSVVDTQYAWARSRDEWRYRGFVLHAMVTHPLRAIKRLLGISTPRPRVQFRAR